MSTNSASPDDSAARTSALENITVDFLRSYPALQPKSDDQLRDIVTKLNNELIETTADLGRVSRESLVAIKLPVLAIDALKPVQRTEKTVANIDALKLVQRTEKTVANTLLSNISIENVWKSVLRIRSDIEGDSATALVFDVFEDEKGAYLYLLVNHHYKMAQVNTYYLEFCSSDGVYYEVDFFEYAEFLVYKESTEFDYSIKKLRLNPEIWDVNPGIASRKPVAQPEGKRARRATVAAKKETVLKADVICKTPSFWYGSVSPLDNVNVFALPGAVEGRWVASTIVQSVSLRSFYVQALSAPGGSGGAVIATSSGLVVGFVGGANDYKDGKHTSSFNAYVMSTHALPRRLSSPQSSPTIQSS